ncbi:MAG: DedA family protein [Thermoprotei archaeon]|nr:MAG: DedA family protein [Thermoprotei archaeon]RLE99767.1 MAG: DedA family protein [Thermoprotei archaeon]HDI74904.1 DedA family protein [Thermoprotei archaeon]
MALESALVPIPSEIVMPYSGYVAYLNSSLSMVLEASFAGTLGNLLGSLLAYYLGYGVGKPLLLKYGKYFLVTRDKLEYAEKLFSKYGDYAVFFGRLMPAVRTIISFPAGVFKMKLGKFILLTVAGSIPWNTTLVLLGYWLGPSWTILEEYFHVLDIIVVIGALIVLVYLLCRLKSERS